MDGKLLYSIKNDMENFRRMTLGNVVVMGRKTFESLPNGKPLDGRVNIIVTSNEDYSVEACDNVFIVNSLEGAIELCEAMFYDKEIFLIGGASVYKEALDKGLVDEMRITYVKDNADGDVFFPLVREDEWYVYYESMEQKDLGGITFYLQILKKKNK